MITVLGGPIPEELEQERQLHEQRYQRTQRLIELLLDGYRAGELRFEPYARIVRVVIKVNLRDKPDAADLLLGQAVAAALDADRKNLGRGRRGVPQSIREASLEVLEEVLKREGLPLTRAAGNAYERVCNIFTEAGYPNISPSELEKWRATRE